MVFGKLTLLLGACAVNAVRVRVIESRPKKPVYHFVAFAYGKNVPKEDVKKVREKFLDLKRTCRLGGKAYIAEISAGDQNSPENVGQSYQDGYMVKFANERLRDHYIGCLDKPCGSGGTVPKGGYCKSHDDFKIFVGDKLASTYTGMNQGAYNPGALVFDYKADARGDLSPRVTHSVFFRFKKGTSEAIKKKTRARFMALKRGCKGIKTLVSGDQNSKEPVHQRYEQGYFFVFESQKALNFYLGCLDKPCRLGGKQPAGGFCRAHDGFKAFVGKHLNVDDKPKNLNQIDVAGFNYHPGVFVFDFTSTK